MRERRSIGVAALTAGLLSIAGLAVGCADAKDSATVPKALEPLVALADAGQWRSTGDDQFEVWICHVPNDTAAAVYGGLPLRAELTSAGVASVLAEHVTRYFDQLAHGHYRPVFVAGGEITMAATDEPQACIDQAIAAAAGTTRAVIAVADAEHAGDQPGGFGSGGDACAAAPPCPVAESRRFAYVGASDFNPSWGDRPPMDLVEHEIGHSLGWVHSGFVEDAIPPYQSALDLMSNSAAPRDTDPEQRDGPDTLGVNRLIAGWLSIDDVWLSDEDGGTVTLAPSTGDHGTRLAVVALDGGRFLTIELVLAEGFDAHLPTDGIAVHLVEVIDGVLQPITPVTGEPPFTDLVAVGESLDTNGWRIAVETDWRVTITPAG